MPTDLLSGQGNAMGKGWRGDSEWKDGREKRKTNGRGGRSIMDVSHLSF